MALPTPSSCSATSSNASRWHNCERAREDPTRGARWRPRRPPTRRTPTGSAEIFLLFSALWRLLRGEDQRARKVRWMIGLLRPYRGRMTLMFVALLIETGAGLGAALPRRAGNRRRRLRDQDRRPQRAGLDSRRLRRRRPALRGRHLRGDLPGRMGRHARPPGSARAALLPHPVDVDRLLHAPQPRRPDLADDQRRRGAQSTRHRRGRDDVLEHSDPGRGSRDPARCST